MKPATPKTKIVKVEAKNLAIHPTAQRLISTDHLRKLREKFDLDAIGVIHAVEYEINGVTQLWVVDGQHRLRILMDEGFGDWVVTVLVHLDIKDEAGSCDKFLELNFKKPVSAYDKFEKANLAKHANETGVTKVLRDHQLVTSRSASDGAVCCVTALTKLYKADEGVTLRATLDTIMAAWGRTTAACEGKLIEGMGIVFQTYNGSIDRPALVKKLSKYPGGASGLLGDAKGLRQYRRVSLARCVAERVVDLYNTNRRSGKLDPL